MLEASFSVCVPAADSCYCPSYVLQITAVVSMTLRVGSQAENSFNSVERLEEYTNIPPEEEEQQQQHQHKQRRQHAGRKMHRPAAGAGGGGGGLNEPLLPVVANAADAAGGGGGGGDEGIGLSPDWPQEGSIEFKNVMMR
jgi:ABC-type multidrug transport system fused ATPase/permease subunit